MYKFEFSVIFSPYLLNEGVSVLGIELFCVLKLRVKMCLSVFIVPNGRVCDLSDMNYVFNVYSSSPPPYICHAVGSPVDPFRSHVSRSLFKVLALFRSFLALSFYHHHHHHHISAMQLGHLLTRSGLTCLQRSTTIPSASRTVVFHYSG